MLKDRPFKHVQSERQYLFWSLGLFQETLACISREGSTLQNASHFLIQNNEKIGGKTNDPPLFTWAIRVTVIDSVHFRRNIVFQSWNTMNRPKNGLFRAKSALPRLSPPITGFVIIQNSQGVSDWLTEVSICARQILALWSQPMPSQQSFDGWKC